MVPGKSRARLQANPIDNYSLQLTVQASAVQKQQFDCRVNKELLPSHKLLNVDDDKNFHNKPETTFHGDSFHLCSEPLSKLTAGDMSHGPSSMKCKSRQSSQSAVPSPSHGQGTFPYLPGDNVIFSELPSTPGIPVVYRTAEQRAECSDRLNLDRRNLTVCPILEGEQQLRLLNFQHNLITQIQHVSNLHCLIFLDLYNNQIEEISGLSSLKSLRVLMLGKNRIKTISNLEHLTDLDVLDLHANQISRMENINHLTELRVLNLAGNLIVHVENVSGLDSLTELNLRRNRIESVRDADTLPCLQRLFLSFNNISRFENIVCLANSLSLSEVTLDGNPIAQESWYKRTILRHMVQVRQLDMKKITEEEKRMASVMARKEDDKKREIHKQAILKEKRRLAISNAARQWERQQSLAFVKDAQLAQVPPLCAASNIKPGHLHECESRCPEEMLTSGIQGLSIVESHLAELERDTLHLYGLGALESLERGWGVQTAAIVTTVSFMFLDFDEIVPVLPRLRMKFPNILVTPVDVVTGERLFGILARVAASHLPQPRLLSLLGEIKKKQLNFILEGKGKRPGSTVGECPENIKLGDESLGRAVLNYSTKDLTSEQFQETKMFCQGYVQGLVKEAALIDVKNASLHKLWPQIFIELVRDCVIQMSNKNSHMKLCLKKIMEQK
ncbi:leucine-rich repeat-containing protein 49 isoform X2 [Narcine bancroftii]|uniref:leucine-rich repeat-containing protein 49 isoform X2 n=1 Tax=Narcine bancroftii TaxID=1343680 RepID=UPI0038315CD0